MINYILLAFALVAIVGGWFWRKRLIAKADEPPTKKQKRNTKLALMLLVLGAYIFITQLLILLLGKKETEPLSVSLWAARIDIGGYSLSTTVLYSWIVMAVLIALALVFHFTVLRRMEKVPKGIQNALEATVELLSKYTNSQAKGSGEILSSYLFTIGLFMIGCAGLELFGLRAPTSDITFTFSLAFITFLLINWFGIRKKGVLGRVKALAEPTPVVFPIRVITEIAIPISLASRLFGNMLGGMIVMELLYVSLGGYAVGIPSVLGLYFNVFHPLIQAFIFITLTLTFINEAIEVSGS